MKKLLMILVLALIGVNVSAQKLGHINAQEIMLKTNEYKAASTEMERYTAELTKQLEMYAKLLQDAEAQFKKDAPSLPDEIKEDRYAELMEKGQKFQQQQMEAEQSLQEKEAKLLNDVMLKVQGAVATVAKANGYVYVFDVNNCHYAGGEDIGDLVKKELGVTE